MKQYASCKQMTQLSKAGYDVESCEAVCASVGELIKWVRDNALSDTDLEILFTEDGVYAMLIYEDNNDIPPAMSAFDDNELIDALYELVLKIKED